MRLSSVFTYRGLGLEDRICRRVFGRDGRARLAFTDKRPLSTKIRQPFHLSHRNQISPVCISLSLRSVTLNQPHIPSFLAGTHCSPSATPRARLRSCPAPLAAVRTPFEHGPDEMIGGDCEAGSDEDGEAGSSDAGSRPPLRKKVVLAAADPREEDHRAAVGIAAVGRPVMRRSDHDMSAGDVGGSSKQRSQWIDGVESSSCRKPPESSVRAQWQQGGAKAVKRGKQTDRSIDVCCRSWGRRAGCLLALFCAVR